MSKTYLPRLVIFDMAGTTVQDQGEVPAAFTAALSQQGIAVSAEELNAVRGASKRQAVLNLMPAGPDRPARAEQAYAAFKTDLARRFSESVQAVSGAEQTFAWLRKQDVKVALNTGFDREITDLLLAALEWGDNVVDAVACGDEVLRGRPAPHLIFRCMELTETLSVHEVAVLGDTVLDLRAGYNAGVRWNIGVLSGAHSREKLERETHTHLIPSAAHLPEVLQV